MIDEVDEDDAPRATLPKKQRVKGKENAAQEVKVQKPSDEDIKPKKTPKPANSKRNALIIEDESASAQLDDTEDPPRLEKAAPSKPPQDVQIDVMDINSDVVSTTGAPSLVTRDAKTAEVPTPLSDGDAHVDVMDMASPTPPARPARSPQRPTPKFLPREESPVRPPPASTSLLSVSSTTSTTQAESHTDAETLVEPLPLQVNGTEAERLTEEDGSLTVEEWIRQEIEVHYERLRRDGEMKIKLFKERAEEVRRQIELL